MQNYDGLGLIEVCIPKSQKERKYIDDAVLACTELGFKEADVRSLLQRYVSENGVKKPEELVQFALREL